MKTLRQTLVDEMCIADKTRNAVADGTLTERELAGQYLHYYSFATSNEWIVGEVKRTLTNLRCYPNINKDEILRLVSEALQ